MSDGGLDDYFGAIAVANRLRDGDFEMLAKLVNVLDESGTQPEMSNLVLAIIWDLLPDEAHNKMIASARAEGKSNVIDFLTGKRRR
jgi:hypothetical protein